MKSNWESISTFCQALRPILKGSYKTATVVKARYEHQIEVQGTGVCLLHGPMFVARFDSLRFDSPSLVFIGKVRRSRVHRQSEKQSRGGYTLDFVPLILRIQVLCRTKRQSHPPLLWVQLRLKNCPLVVYTTAGVQEIILKFKMMSCEYLNILVFNIQMCLLQLCLFFNSKSLFRQSRREVHLDFLEP